MLTSAYAQQKGGPFVRNDIKKQASASLQREASSSSREHGSDGDQLTTYDRISPTTWLLLQALGCICFIDRNI